MGSLKLPAAVPDRQISFLFENDRLEGLSDLDHDKIVSALAQILMQASGLSVEELDDGER